MREAWTDWTIMAQYPRKIAKRAVPIAIILLNVGMMSMRTKFLWFPLHPAGYVIGVAPGTIDNYWFTLLICVVIKGLLLKHGGIRSYHRAIPFFIGMVLGQSLIGCFWPLMSIVFRTSVYNWI